MGFTSIFLIVVAVALTAFAAFAAARVMQYREAVPQRDDNIDLSRYAPMGRLLDPEEAAFLAAQPGTTPQQVREFRQSRRRIFRSYLRELSADFQVLHTEARQLAAVSPEKNHELVEMLLRQQVQFWAAILGIETQLVLDAAGIGRVDPRRLLDGVEALHAAVVRATAIPGPIPVN
jgi:hypothetical protein